MDSPDVIGWLLSRFGGNVPVVGSFWDFITGSGRDTIHDTLEIVLNRPTPNFSSQAFLDMYDYTFYIGLLLGAIVQAIAVGRAALGEGPLAVFKAAVVDYLLLFVVAYSIPAIATVGTTFIKQMTEGIVMLFGGEPKVSWFESFLGASPMLSWQSIFYALLGILLLVEITAISIVPYVLVIAGPVMFAMRNLGEPGRRINQSLWSNLAWSISAFFPFVFVLVLGNWLMTSLPAGSFISVGSGIGNVVTLIFLAVTGYVPIWLHSKTKSMSVRIENAIRSKSSNNGGQSTGGTVQAGPAPAPRFSSAATAANLAGNAFSEPSEKSTAQKVGKIATQVGMATARSHPATSAVATTVATTAKHIDKRQTQQAAAPSGSPASQTPTAQKPPASSGTVQSAGPARQAAPPRKTKE